MMANNWKTEGTLLSTQNSSFAYVPIKNDPNKNLLKQGFHQDNYLLFFNNQETVAEIIIVRWPIFIF